MPFRIGEEKSGFDKLAAFLMAERARGGVALICYGGIAPNIAWLVSPFLLGRMS